MDVGIGLPSMIPGTDGRALVNWATQAEEAGFSTLATLGRLVFDGYDDLIALAAAAAVTERIRLMTSVLLSPLYPNAALLAKQAASLDRLSGGRFVFGIGLGGREDDFEASRLTTAGRGRRLDTQLEEMKRIWSGEERGYAGAIGPRPARPEGPPLILARGTGCAAALRRAARFADGWIMGGGTPEMFAGNSASVDEAWRDAGRSDKPRKLALAYFGLGRDAKQTAELYIKHYYGWLGGIADHLAASVIVSQEMAKDWISAFANSGCDELIIFPTSAQAGQVRLLSEAIG